MGLRALDVRRARPGVGELARVQQVEVVIELVGLRGGGQHDAMPAVAQGLQEVARTLEGLDLGDQRGVLLLLGVADGVAVVAVERLAGQCRHELVGAHADVVVDPDTVRGPRRGPGTRGTRPRRGGSWCRRASRRRRGWRPAWRVGSRAGVTRDRRAAPAEPVALTRWRRWCCAPAPRGGPRRAPRRPSRRRPAGRRDAATSRGPRRRGPPRRPSGRPRCGCRSAATARRSGCGPAGRRPRPGSTVRGRSPPTGLPCSKNARTNATASSSARRKSGLATPPGSTRPS